MANYVQRALEILDEECPGLDSDLAQLYVLLVLTNGPNTTLPDVHDAWGVWRNTTNPEHRSLVPFGELTVAVQELDRKYMDAIRATARRLSRESSNA